MIQPKNNKNNEVNSIDLYKIGCMGKITSFKETEDGRFIIDLKGIIRFKITKEILSNKKSSNF